MRLNKFAFIPLIVLFPLISMSQNEGVNFEKGMSWKKILEKAKAQNKYIFVDCYTTWCAPCRYMKQKVFSQDSVAVFFNSQFINVAVQMDKTLHDSEDVKKWYDYAKTIETDLSISAYPTFLFFSPNGQPVHRLVGVYEGHDLIEKTKEVFIPEKQYYTLINHYRDHKGDSIFLLNAFHVALNQYDKLNASKIAEYYLEAVKDSFAKETLLLIVQSVNSTGDNIFQFLIKNTQRIDLVLRGDKEIENVLASTVVSERIDPLFESKGAVLNYLEISDSLKKAFPQLSSTIQIWIEGRFKSGIAEAINKSIYSHGGNRLNWGIVRKKLATDYPDFDWSQVLAEKKAEYYWKKEQWGECERAALALLDHFGYKMGQRELNNIVYDYLFDHSTNPKALNTALKWSKRSIDLSPDEYHNLDTYANLLYKTGRRQSALIWEQKALDKCKLAKDPGTLQEICSNFEKMKNREKTWKGK